MSDELIKNILLESEKLFNFDSGRAYLTLDRNKIILAFENLRKIIFPKYFCDYKTDEDLKTYIPYILNQTSNILNEQINLVLSEKSELQDIETIKEKTKNIVDEFISKIPDISQKLYKDIEATFNNDPAAECKSQIIFSYPGITAITFYRLAHELALLNVPLIPRIATEHAHSLTGIDIHPGANIGTSLCIDHGTGIVIGETTKIGDNVKIYQGVTLGALSIKNRESTINKKRHPTIENNVTLYAGCTVLGGETVIGENSIIGGSAFIVKSIPPNTIVSVELPKLRLKEVV